MAGGLRRRAVRVVGLVLAAAAGGGPGRAELNGVEVDASHGSIALMTGCFDRVGGDADLRDGQIVVTDLWAKALAMGTVRGPCRSTSSPVPTSSTPSGSSVTRSWATATAPSIAANDGRWDATGFEAELFCPGPAESFGVADVPAWVCDP
jgi:hypothetical protein